MPYIGNKYEIGDHNNSWKPLDDISSYVATFDGSATNAVSTTNNTIRVPEHRFIQGQRVTYSNGGGGNIGGLTSGTAYYIIHDTNNEFKLATSLSNANASTAINLSAVGSGSSHTITAAFDGVNKKFKITYSGGRSSRFTSATQLTVAINNIVQRANDTATFTDGFGISDNEKIVFNVAPVAADIFWGNILSASLPTFDISDNKLDNFTGNGSTTDFTLSHIPANNESIIVTVNGVVQHPTDKNGTRAYSLDASVLVFTAAPANGDEIQVRHIGFAGATTSAVTGFYGRTGNVTLSSSADDAIVGVITATKFSGPFVGTITGGNDIVAGIITATKIDLNGDIDVDGHTNLDNVSIAGVTTAAGNIIANGSIDLAGDIDVDGHTNLDNVSVAGVSTLTGNVTIQSDFKFANQSIDNAVNWGKVASILQVRDGSKLTLGNSNDLQLYHNNLWNYIDNIGTKNFVIRVNGTDNALVALPDGQTSLYYSGDEKIQTTNTGSVVTGILTATDFSGAAGGAADFPNGLTGTTATFSGNVSVGGTLTYEDVTNVDAVGLITARAGIEVTGGTLKLPAVLQTNTDVDCKVLYQHNDNVIHGGSTLNWNPAYDTLKVNSNLISANSMYGAGGTLKVAASNHSSTSYVLITDKVEIGGLVGIGTNNPDGNLHVYNSTAGSVTAATDANDLVLESAANVGMSFLTGATSLSRIKFGDTTATNRGIFYFNHSTTSFNFQLTSSLKLTIDSSGNIIPGAAGTQNLGSTSKEFNNLYLGDSGKVQLGSSQDLQLWHDAGAHSYIRTTGSGQNLYLQTTNSQVIIGEDGGHIGLIYNAGAALVLRHNNSQKFTTSEIGISVTGEVAATQDYPNYRPTLDFNFAAVKKLDPRITYQRTGPASYIDEFGKVVLVGANTPRFDHDPFTGESKGLLIEDVRTNLIYPSSNWSVGNPGWTINNSNITVTTNTSDTKDPAGTYGASKLVATQGDTQMKDIWWTPSNLTFASNTKYAVSVFAKSTTGLVLQLRPRGQGSNKAWVNYNLATGEFGSYGGSTLESKKIEKYPNGWYRCSLVFTGSGTSGSGGVGTLIMDSPTATEASSHTGNASKSLYLWGIQHEVGSFVTSYIPTSGAAVSRQEDFISITGEEHNDFWNTSEGTYFITYEPLERAVGDGVIIGSKRGNNGSGYPWPLYRHDTANTNNFKSYDMNGIISMSTTWADRRESWALGFNGTNGQIYRNGDNVGGNTNMRGLIDADELWIGSSGTGSMYSMHVKRFMYYSKRITDSQLKTLTS